MIEVFCLFYGFTQIRGPYHKNNQEIK